MNLRHAWFDKLLLPAALLLFLPTWLWLGQAWLSDPYYSHGPLVLVVSLYLFWARGKVLAAAPGQPSHVGWLLLAVALAVHLWATWWRAYYISALTIPLVLSGVLAVRYGWRSVRRFLFPLAFLILLVPLPIAERFGPALAAGTTAAATALAQLAGISARSQGAQVYLPNSTFTVGIPCGGLRSAIAITTLAALFAYSVRGPAWARGLIFLAGLPAALAANTLRLTLLFGLANGWGAQAGLAYFDSPWSSATLFLGAFLLLLALARLLRCGNVRWEAVLP